MASVNVLILMYSTLTIYILNMQIFRWVGCVCGGSSGADGRALVMTSGILYSVMRVEGSILVVAVSLSKKLTHTCFSRLRSKNEYLVIDWGGHDRWLGSNIMQQTVLWALVSSPRAAPLSVP